MNFLKLKDIIEKYFPKLKWKEKVLKIIKMDKKKFY